MLITSLSITYVKFHKDFHFRYYALTKVFFNPFDEISNKRILTVLWMASIIFSLPFLITSDIDYYDYNSTQVICINDNTYLYNITFNKYFSSASYLFSMIVEFSIPTLIVIYFSSRIIIHLFIVYRDSLRGIPITHHPNRCGVTKRLLSILLLFILKNTFYILITYRSHIIAEGLTSCKEYSYYFTYYKVFRLTIFGNSIIYFLDERRVQITIRQDILY